MWLNNKITQREVAEKLGVSEVTVYTRFSQGCKDKPRKCRRYTIRKRKTGEVLGTNLTAKESLFVCGFTNLPSFYSMIRRELDGHSTKFIITEDTKIF